LTFPKGKGAAFPSIGRQALEENQMQTRSKIVAGLAGLVLAVGATVATAQNGPAMFSALMAANNKMMGPMMGLRNTGNPDADFVSMMIPHHQGAVEMAQAELSYGTDPQIRALAEAIVKAQQDEIAMMQKWLKDHGR
jgi:uncharacterized protein (DUF305 family)